MANLVIVESPGKVATINNYLGSNYKVIASVGHVRDLPKSSLGVDIDNNFEAHYINIRGKGPVITELKAAAKKANKIFLATDDDREGEAISWHLATVLGIPIEKTRRITFNEITKNAVKEAIRNPRTINTALVESQQARRILDRIVGYKLSPYLWKTVRGGLSAGRVQSVATKIIVEREAQINSFIPTEFWTIEAYHKNSLGEDFVSRFYGEGQSKLELENEAQVKAILSDIENGSFTVESVKNTVKRRHPAPPFTTSTMQQDAVKKLGFNTQKIMSIAQELYEGINIGSENGGVTGLITYMRTDSLRISTDAQELARSYILEKFGESHITETPRIYKSKNDAQDAHEAIRPSNVNLEPLRIKKYLTNEQYKLYKLIWDRFVSSQMADAEIDSTSVDIRCGKYIFRSSGQSVRFSGFLAVYEDMGDGDEDATNSLPALSENEKLSTVKVDPIQHFTEPPARFNEGTLVRFLEEKGIGRPSTTATIISTIISRGYVKRDGKTLKPTELGEVTTKLMEEHFPDIVDYAFTAQMESDLDSVASGENSLVGILSTFYDSFKDELENAEKSAEENPIELQSELTDIVCDKCGSLMVVKSGRFGKFAACPNYPQCRNTKPIDTAGKEKAQPEKQDPTGIACEICGEPMVIRSGKYGSFYACSAFPKCKNTVKIETPSDIPCPLCGSPIVTRRSKKKSVFYGCSSYPSCSFVSWYKPSSTPCPTCGMPLCYKKPEDETPVCCNKECPESK